MLELSFSMDTSEEADSDSVLLKLSSTKMIVSIPTNVIVQIDKSLDLIDMLSNSLDIFDPLLPIPEARYL
ncbi:hypothetical protein A3752_06100 [Oleiphilus sp. HI0081]|jgi:hypothetical protein|nr:hypothetical protein A3729_22705 [Oleiphilus sp. HI0043]KZY47616.1 hypothetical protein A3732_06565 [Oleiphilus sp. HI0050]KZY52102.1 hypothetical protein A3735_22095 [Oleiphilus sp. HI0061]KZY72822.1 hypothetical protein A3740_20180 [Oleiphilus sp. HI0068]KZY80715.1 hypothetical protein A3741_00430 [Oleiphilus sp. HI0069]KZY89897.1 hypothetical protein A3743_07775 [Oleiphilus sp. HI0072]KZZ11677.1 hypothetical protein A3749_08390 [Oleiphilus sp. HI0078]KZZ22546.1 hypothetical protein A37